MRARSTASILVVCICLGAAPGRSVHAAPPSTGFTYQGRVTQNGVPFNGTASLAFSLWDAATSPPGVQLGTRQVLSGVNVTLGVFTVELNAAGQFGPSAFNGDARWLQVEVNGTTLSPRQPLTAVPYALKARGVDGFSLDAADGSPQDVVYVDSDGKVGIGTLTPARALQVGDAAVADSEGMIRFASRSGISADTRTWDVGVPETDADALNGYSFVIDDVLRGTEPEFTIQWGSGHVGIGTDWPDMSLEVTTPSYYGSPAIGAAQGASYAYLHVSEPYSHSLIWDNSKAMRFGTETSRGAGYVEHMRINPDGRVGIGTQNLNDFKLLVYGGEENGLIGWTDAALGVGVYGTGESPGSVGVQGSANGLNGVGVRGTATGMGGAGVVGQAYAPGTIAGYFEGDVQVVGILSKLGGMFKIDHPLDPANKYLQHSFVESPDMMNIYNGNTTTDDRGFAEVLLPGYFEALNRDFRYQLTVIDSGDDFVQAKVAQEVRDNRFVIRTSLPGVKVSWQVTGIRKDAYAEAHRIVVEEDKPEAERGTYLSPAEHGQPEQKGKGRGW